MLLQAALNGDRSRGEHPAVPLTAEELARDAAACAAAGAGAMHIHPRGEEGRERLDAGIVDPAVRAVRAACGVPVGVSTGAWIEPDVERRIALVREWEAPDYASVNLSEPGAERVTAALLERGIGIEAGVWSVEDAERLAATGLAGRLTRVLIEAIDLDPDRAVALVDGIHAALDARGIAAPRLQHGEGAATWVTFQDAVRRGLDTRIGLEDTLVGPDGDPAAGNEALVRAARAYADAAAAP